MPCTHDLPCAEGTKEVVVAIPQSERLEFGLKKEIVCPKGLVPILPVGMKVEYWSRTHKRWIRGLLSVEITPSTFKEEARAQYSIRVCFRSSTQMRNGLPLSGFRPLITTNDHLEVFKAGAWTPCRLDKRTRAKAMAKGRHRISIGAAEGGQPQAVDGVPSVWLRRCFPVGSQVEVYLGLEAGWCPAVVEPRAPPLCDDGDALAEDDVDFGFGASVAGVLISTATAASMMSELAEPSGYGEGPTLASVLEGAELGGSPRSTAESDAEHPVPKVAGRLLGPASLGNVGFDAGKQLWYDVSVRVAQSDELRIMPSYVVRQLSWSIGDP